MITSGTVQNKPDVLKSCGKCVLEALRDVTCQDKCKHLREVHLVNKSEGITDMLRDIFEEAERATKSGKYQKPGTSASRKAVTSDHEESSGDEGQSFKTVNEPRMNQSLNSNIKQATESDGFDSLAKSRINYGKDNNNPEFSVGDTWCFRRPGTDSRCQVKRWQFNNNLR